jgi:hydrogenase maturation protease
MADARVLVAGIGNVFLGDDGFGVEVAQLLLRRGRLRPPLAKVVDYGIRGFDLAFEMLGEHESTVLIDVTPRGDEPGTLYVIEPDLDSAVSDCGAITEHGQGAFEGHAMTPAAVFELVRTLGGTPRRVRVVGCEPETFGDAGAGRMGLSERVQRSVVPAADLVERLVTEIACPSSRDAGEVTSRA